MGYLLGMPWDMQGGKVFNLDHKSVWKKISYKKNVNGMSGKLQPKIKGGVADPNRLCIRIYVDQKEELSALSMKDVIQPDIDGFETDVVPIGIIRALHPKKPGKTKAKRLKGKSKDGKVYALNEQRKKFRPSPAGVSAIYKGGSACTLGYFAKDLKDGKIVIIANNHCTCDENQLSPGHEYLQPSPRDGGLDGDILGRLKRFVPLKDANDNGGSWLIDLIIRFLQWLLDLIFGQRRLPSPTYNKVDLGIIDVDPKNIKLEILNIGKIKGKRRGEIGELLEKMGRTTGHTKDGPLIDNDWYGQIGYSNRTLYFGPCGLIEKEGYSDGGDSSSGEVLQIDKNIAGLLFAGSNTHTIFCHWDFIEELGNVEILIPD